MRRPGDELPAVAAGSSVFSFAAPVALFANMMSIGFSTV
jgi:hypothetical protein